MALALEAGQKAICLLKNDDNLLPFSKNIKSVAVVGSLADLPALGGYSPRNVDAVTILDGIRKKFGKDFTINFEADTQPMEVLTTDEARYLRTPDNQQTGLLAEYFNNPELEG